MWIGQHVLFLKGVQVGSGAILGTMALMSSKKYRSNCSYRGNPARLLRENIFFLKDDCYRFLDEDIKKYSICERNDYIFEKDDTTISFDAIEYKLNHSTLDAKMDLLHKLSSSKDKNRFFI